MGRLIALLYGLAAYLVFFFAFLYAIGFVEGLLVPKGIDDGAAGPLVPALIVNVLLMSVFAIQHSVMARPAFKRWWTRFVPHSIERSTYVLLASLALVLLFWQWRSMADPIWTVNNVIGRYALWTLFFLGWGIVLLSTYLINHFDLFGLKQVNDYRRGLEYKEPGFVQPLLYKVVRHPIMLGFIIAFWATPQMSVGHLLFAAVTTAYILVAIQIEERDIVNVHGEVYEDYRRQVSMIVPIPKKKRSDPV